MPAYLYVHHMCEVVYVSQKSMLDPGNCSYRLLWASLGGEGNQTSAKAAGAVNSLANAPEPDI